MYIEPNSELILLSNCPLDTTYEHTLYFEDKTEQYNYFIGLKKRTFDKQSYIRKSKGVVHLEILADKIYDCNYMMFRNTSYGNKWFYAFITNVEYVSNTSCYVTFIVDFIQTWFLDCTLKQSFVEREHSVTDVIGENTVIENIEIGEYITTAETIAPISGLLTLVIYSTFDFDGFGHKITTQMLAGNVVPCYIYALPYTPSSISVELQEFLTQASEKADAIVAMFTVPTSIYQLAIQKTEAIELNFDCATRTLSKQPRNKKLFTYPYCCLNVQANAQITELHYELFDNDNSPKCTILSGFGPNISIACLPLNYDGVNGKNFSHIVTLQGYPLIPWTTQYFQQWLAQNTGKIISSTITNLMSSGANVKSGLASGAVSFLSGNLSGVAQAGSNIYGGFISPIAHLIDIMGETTRAMSIPNSMSGCAEASNALSVSGNLNIRTYCRSIKPEYIDILDGFFDKFGYATHKLKIPNISSRPHWNYTKTVGCVLVGNAPADDIRAICKCFDNGITFWKNGDEVGNYNLDNTV